MLTPERLGGSAFPYAPDCASGMTLRDWMAGMALQGLLAKQDLCPPAVERGEDRIGDRYAHMAYGFADAMLAERKKGQG